MHLDVPHLGPVQLHHLTGRARVAQRLIQANRRPQFLSQACMPHEFVGMEWLLDVEQSCIVERSQRCFVARPLVGAVRVYCEREVAALEPLTSGLDRYRVPPGCHLDFYARVSMTHRVADRTLQLGAVACRGTP